MEPINQLKRLKLKHILAASGAILLLHGFYVTASVGRIGLLNAFLGIYLLLLAYLEIKLEQKFMKENKDIKEISRLIDVGDNEKEYRNMLQTPIVGITLIYFMVWLLALIAEPSNETNTLTIITATLGLIILGYATQKYTKK